MRSSKPDWLPAWAKRLQWLLYLCFIPYLALILFGDPFEHPYVVIGLFAGMFVPAAVRAYFMMHAVARGDINPFTTRSRRPD